MSMDKINSYYTQAIVGKPMLMVLGTPIKPSLQPSVGAAPAWQWPLQRTQWIGLGVLGIFTVALGAYLLSRSGGEGVAGGQPSPQVAPVPAATASASPPAPTGEVQLPFQTASAAQAGEAASASAPVSIQLSSAEFASSIVTPPASSPLPFSKPPTVALSQPVAAPRATPASEKERPPSVVMDVSAAAKPAAATPPVAKPADMAQTKPASIAPATAPPVANVPGIRPQGQGRLVGPSKDVPIGEPGRAAPTAVGSKVTIVDIDKAGKYVLITNPETRLPQKVEIGQKIFTGETIRGIDPASGRVHLDDGRTLTMQ